MTACGITGEVDLPAAVIDAHAAGTLVIFVGAGASRNPPSDLPLFDGLAEQIASRVARPYDGDGHPDIYLGRLEKDGVNVHASDPDRVIAFTRRDGQTEVLVVASLNNQPFQNSYRIQTDPDRLPAGLWRETFNSDSEIYGGDNVGNQGAAIPADNGQIELVIPANALLVQRS